MSDIIGKVNNAVSSVVSYGTTHKEQVGKSVVNGVLLFIILMIFGCFDFVHLTFNINLLTTVAYWSKTITKTIAGLCAYNIGINLTWDREISKDYELKEQASKYKSLSKTKDNVSFNHYVTKVFNINEKKKAYISYINRKIYKLNKFAKNKDKLLYSAYSNDEKEMESLNNQKALNKYCIKLAELEKLKSDEYINENIDRIQIKYDYVDPIIFDLELDGKSSYSGFKVKGNVGSGKAKQTASVMLGMIATSSLLASIGIDPNAGEMVDQLNSFWHYFVTAVADVGVVMWQVIRGMLVSRKIISNEITLPLVNRNRVLSSYNEWCIENKIEKSKSFLIYEKIIESERSIEQ